MDEFRWNMETAPELLVKYGFVRQYDTWEYDLVIDTGDGGASWYECIGVLILNSDGSIEAAGQVDEYLVEQLFRDGIIYEIHN